MTLMALMCCLSNQNIEFVMVGDNPIKTTYAAEYRKESMWIIMLVV